MKNNIFAELFKTILIADKDESRKAAREVRKVLYSATSERGKYEIIESIVDKAPDGYKKIVEDWRQENFVRAISVIYFAGNKKDKPNFLFPWLLELIQHKNGNIRHAAVRMLETEFGPLTYHIRIPGKKSSSLGITPQEADRVLFELYANINNLLAMYWRPEYKRYKYISSLPTGVYKSLQLVLSRLEDLCGKEYMDQLRLIAPRDF